MSDLQCLDVAEGFRWSIKSFGEEGKVELRGFLRQRLLGGAEILVAVEENKVVGFAVIVDWHALSDAKKLDAMEVARSYRCKGIGSMLMRRILDGWDTLIALTLLAEAGYEEWLSRFYQRFGFMRMTRDVMVRISGGSDKLKGWIEYMEGVLEGYSYEMYQVQPLLPVWGRRYAPWLRYTVDVYKPLLKEMKTRVEGRGRA